MKILLIEDNVDAAKTLRTALNQQFLTDLAFTGEDGEYLAHLNDYDLIILDLGLPDISGLEVCRQIRSNGNSAPILILTGDSEITTKIACLDAGADDYLVKPYHLDELLARIRALLRRNPDNFTSNIIKVGDLILDAARKNVFLKGKMVQLRRREFDLLEYLMHNNGKVLTRDMILNHVWDSAYDSATNTVDVHIKYLRDKLHNKNIIKTVHGVGYKFES